MQSEKLSIKHDQPDQHFVSAQLYVLAEWLQDMPAQDVDLNGIFATAKGETLLYNAPKHSETTRSYICLLCRGTVADLQRDNIDMMKG
jgi:hypothetical protein